MPSSEPISVPYLEAEIDGELRRFPLAADQIIQIGRSDKNHVVIADDLASRHHAMLQRSEEGQFYITDLGSSNGTFVNGARISAPVILHPGDRVSIGNHEFSFHQEAALPPQPEDDPDPNEMKSTGMLFRESLITVLVVDIVDFTGLAQRIDASKLSLVTGTFFREAGKALQERGAWAQKYIGDAVMSVWLHRKKAPEQREMIAVFDGLFQIASIAASLQARFKLLTPILIGAGINTGLATVGNMGSMASSDYTALGDVVNKAFRLESATREIECDLALGQGTYDFLHPTFDSQPFFECCSLKLKGYDGPVLAYAAHISSIPTMLDALREGQETLSS